LPNAKLRCKKCKEYFPRKQIKDRPTGFCDGECATQWIVAKGAKDRDKKIKTVTAKPKKAVKKKKKKLKSIAKMVESAAELLQLLVRLKASDDNGYCTCVTCGITRHYKDSMQGGHFISRKWLATKIMVENVNPQCAACNGPFKRGAPIEYTLYMIETYGREFVDELLRLKNKSRKYYRAEVEEIIADFKSQIKAIQTEKGI